MKQEVKNYNIMIRTIHWLSAVVVIGMFAVGLWMVDLSYYSEWYRTAPHWHKSVGILLAVLTLFRFIWRHISAAPKTEGSALEKVASKFVHAAMYLLLIMLFVSGYLISTEDGRSIEVFNLFSVPGIGALFEGQADISGEIHFYTAWALIVFAAIHALAAIKHHVIDKDNTLRKMIGASK